MNETLVFGLTFVAILGSGLIAGLFFVFSVFVMRALDDLPTGQGAAAMQSINRAILTPLFLVPFMGTALVCLALGAFAGFGAFDIEGGGRVYLLIGTAAYLAGVMVLTVVYHVPRNDALEAVDAYSAEGAELWAGYVRHWTAWNHVRTVASSVALGCLVMAIRVG